MPEHIVDCEHVPYGDGRVLVLPVSINGHVHERLTRCRDCIYCRRIVWPPPDARYECRLRPYSRHFTEPDGYCHRARPRGGDGRWSRSG